ncbi:MAG: hypothetical protein WA061_03870 [Microgenomates group bacterium]
MSAVLERAPSTPVLSLIPHEHSFNEENHKYQETYTDSQWLNEYKKSPGSIFKYYSVQNEFDFLKSADELSPEGKTFYIAENVNRYLGEFVGKVPYSTIRYEMDTDGFTFAGMHMMDSYKKAAALSKRERERAEVVGFQIIEDALLNKDKIPNPPTSAYWISPPKDWDYGFIFIFKKEENGKTAEYILRYPENRGEFVQSNKLLDTIEPQSPELHNSDSFLLTPLFGIEKQRDHGDIDRIMRAIGIDERKIDESHYFEEQVKNTLGTWINEYARRVIDLSQKDRRDIDFDWQVEQAEILLLSIYQQAQDILRLFPYQNRSPALTRTFQSDANTFSQELLGIHALQLKKQKNLPQAEGGSCPVINDAQNMTDPVAQFVSNHDIVNALKIGKKLEDILNGESNLKKLLECKCPKCEQEVVAVIENETITCPRKECGNTAPYKC